MATKDKLIKVIARLNALTQDGKLIWEDVTHKNDELPDYAERIIGPIFETSYSDKFLRIFVKSVLVNPLTQVFSLSKYFTQKTESYRQNFTTLIIVNSSGEILWQFPRVSGLEDLLESIRYQVSGVSDFIDEVLSDEDNSS